MTQSTWQNVVAAPDSGLHVAMIMDGNGRWARARGLPREQGHVAGADALRRVVEAAPGAGIRHLTVFAFSADNWKRPQREREALFGLFERYLREEAGRCAEEGVELRCLGQRGRLPASLQEAIAEAERRTWRGMRLTLRLAIDYSARDALRHAASLCAAGDGCLPGAVSRTGMDYALAVVYGQPGRRLPPVDLLIRTAGEQRLSDFLLWECAYAELWFTPTLWPDFQPRELEAALKDYAARKRTFGGLEGASVEGMVEEELMAVRGGRS